MTRNTVTRTSNKLVKAFGKTYDMYIVPAKKQTDRVSKGRGSGGLVTMFKKHLTKYVSQVKCENYRIQGTKFVFTNCDLLIVNCYLPCDPQVAEHDYTELHRTLEDIRILIEKAECDSLLLCGDWNTHFPRNTAHVQIVQNFIENLGVTVFWSNPDDDPQHLIHNVDFTHTTVRNDRMFTSTVDHFMGSTQVYNCVTEAGVVHSVDNFSDHCPVYAKLGIGGIDLSLESVEQRRVPK